jgi:hypothetical protein
MKHEDADGQTCGPDPELPIWFDIECPIQTMDVQAESRENSAQ